MDYATRVVKTGDVLFFSHTSNVYAFSVKTGERLQQYTANKAEVRGIEVVRDIDELVTVSKDHSVKLFNAKSGACRLTLRGHRDQVWFLQVHNNVIYTGSNDNTARSWDLETGKPLVVYRGHRDMLCGLQAIGDVLYTGSFDRTLRSYEAATGKLNTVFVGHTDLVFSLLVDHKHGLFSGSRDKTVRRWDTKTGKQLFVYEGHADTIDTILVKDELTMLWTGSRDATIRAWSIESGATLYVLEGFGADIKCVKELNNTCDDPIIRSFDAASGRLLHEYVGHTKSVSSLVLDENLGQLYSRSADRTARSWDIKTGQAIYVFQARTAAFETYAFGAEMMFGARVGSSEIEVFDLRTESLMRVLKGHKGRVRSLIWVDEHALLYTGGGSKREQWCDIRSWNPKTGECVRVYKGHTYGGIQGIYVRGDRLYSGSHDQTIREWDTTTGKELAQFNDVTARCERVWLLGDSLFAGFQNFDIVEYSIKTYNKVRVLKGHTDNVWYLESHRGKLYSGANDHVIIEWDVATGKELRRFAIHGDWINSLAFWGDYMFSGSRDETVKVTDLRTGEVIRTFTEHSSGVRDVEVYGDTVYSASAEIYTYNAALLARFGIQQTHKLLSEDFVDREVAQYGNIFSFGFMAVLLLIDFLQLLTFGFSDPEQWQNQQVAEAIRVLREFGLTFLDFNLAFAITLGLIYSFIGMFLIQERVESRRFLYPNSRLWKHTWLAFEVYAKMMSRPFFVPLWTVLVSVIDCEQGVLRVLPSLTCWSSSHVVYVAAAAVTCLLYIPLCYRLLRVGSSLAFIEGAGSPLDWSRDHFFPTHSHPLSLSPNGVVFFYMLILTKLVLTVMSTLLVSATSSSSVSDPANVALFVVLILSAVAVIILGYRLPPYFSDRGNRLRSGLDWGLLWTYTGTVFAFAFKSETVFFVWIAGLPFVIAFGYLTHERIRGAVLRHLSGVTSLVPVAASLDVPDAPALMQRQASSLGMVAVTEDKSTLRRRLALQGRASNAGASRRDAGVHLDVTTMRKALPAPSAAPAAAKAVASAPVDTDDHVREAAVMQDGEVVSAAVALEQLEADEAAAKAAKLQARGSIGAGTAVLASTPLGSKGSRRSPGTQARHGSQGSKSARRRAAGSKGSRSGDALYNIGSQGKRTHKTMDELQGQTKGTEEFIDQQR